MQNSHDIQEDFYDFQEATQTGWWQLNYTQQRILLSSYLMDLIGRETDQLPLKSFLNLLGTEDKNRLQPLVTDRRGWESLDEKLSLLTLNGYVQVHMCVKTVFTRDQDDFIEGFLQLADPSLPADPPIENAQDELLKQLNWHQSLTQTLLELTDGTNQDLAIHHILDHVLQSFDAKAVRIFSFDASNYTYSCKYESTRADSEKQSLQQIPCKNQKWILRLLQKKPVFLPQKNQIDIPEKSTNTGCDEAVCALIIPLLSHQNVRGFMKIETPDPQKEWNKMEREAFIALAYIIGTCLDLIHSERMLKHKGEFLDQLLHNIPIGYCRMQSVFRGSESPSDFIYRDVNTQFTESTGIDREKLVGHLYSTVGSLFEEALDPEILAQISTDKTGTLKIQQRLTRVQQVYEVTLYAPQPGNIVLLLKDVSETVRTTEALRKRGEELKRIYSNIPVGIEVYDENGYLIDVNEPVLKMEKVVHKEDLLGLNLFDHPSLPFFAHAQLKEGKEVTFDLNMEDMKINRQYYGVDSLDDLKYLTLKCTVLHDKQGKVENYILIIIDNTEMYETTRQLNEFESTFNSIAEIAEVGFFRWNPLRKIYYSSEQSYRNMGIKMKEGANLTFEEFIRIIHPDDAKDLASYMEDVRAGIRTSHTFEFRIRESGKWKWLRGTSQVVEFDPDQNNIQLVGLNYSINELKKTEQKLMEAKTKAEESDRKKSVFLANISHEIRTPLHAIVGFSELLLETDVQSEQAEYIAIIQKNINHLWQLITDITDLSHIESGPIQISLQSIDVNALCRKAIAAQAGSVPEGIELSFRESADSKEFRIQSDPKWILHILDILLSNALKFTREGTVVLRCQPLPQAVEFAVEDTGIGIEPAHLEAIFERFMKIDNFMPGTGLGLAICKSIIEKMGGEIGVQSETGKGSRFWFTIPRPQSDE